MPFKLRSIGEQGFSEIIWLQLTNFSIVGMTNDQQIWIEK